MKLLQQKIQNLVRWFSYHQQGFTAIQTAIGMTASIIAAGSIATVVVSAGTESGTKVDQVITQSVKNLEGSYMLKSDLIGKAAVAGKKGALGQIVFTVGLVLNDGVMDFTPPNPNPANNGLAGPESANVIVISYMDANQKVDDLYWTVRPLGKNNGDTLLEGGELFQITVGSPVAGSNGGNLIDALNPQLSADTKFTLELATAQTPGLVIEEKTPGTISKITQLR
jgi:hypothetical protein